MFFRSMHGRLFLILLLGMFMAAAGTIMLTHSRQQEMYDRVRTQHLATEINQLVDTLEKAAPTERENILHSFHSMGIHGRMANDAMLPITVRDDILEDALQQRSLDAKFDCGTAEPCYLRRYGNEEVQAHARTAGLSARTGHSARREHV